MEVGPLLGKYWGRSPSAPWPPGLRRRNKRRHPEGTNATGRSPENRLGPQSPVSTHLYSVGWVLFPDSKGFLVTNGPIPAYVRGISKVQGG